MRHSKFFFLLLLVNAVCATTVVFAQTRIHARAEASWKRGRMIGISKMSNVSKRSRCNRVVLTGRVGSIELNEHQEITRLVLETNAGSAGVQLAKTLYAELPIEAETALPELLARGKGVRVTAYSCAGTAETPEADEIRLWRVPRVAVSGTNSPADLTELSDSQLQRNLGETVTMRGVFSLRGKAGPFILVGGRPIYVESQRSFAWGESYARMEGKEVRVTGTLRFAHYAEEHSVKALPVSRPTDHFYFEAETAKVELIEP